LFIAGIQRHKDKTNNWWSDDPILEFPIVKQIMSGRKFHTILRYLHVCDMHSQPLTTSPTYLVKGNILVGNIFIGIFQFFHL